MASTRNNRIQDRRAALREQQKRERDAADTAFKALDSEYDAKVAAARAVAAVVELSGRERAGILLGLEPKDITAYVKLVEDLADDAADDQGDSGDDASDTADESDTSGEATGTAAASIPPQGEPAGAATASV